MRKSILGSGTACVEVLGSKASSRAEGRPVRLKQGLFWLQGSDGQGRDHGLTLGTPGCKFLLRFLPCPTFLCGQVHVAFITCVQGKARNVLESE